MDTIRGAEQCVCLDGWICEEHPDRPWPHDDCGGPGVPCPRCQPADDIRPELRGDWQSVTSTDDDLDT